MGGAYAKREVSGQPEGTGDQNDGKNTRPNSGVFNYSSGEEREQGPKGRKPPGRLARESGTGLLTPKRRVTILENE